MGGPVNVTGSGELWDRKALHRPAAGAGLLSAVDFSTAHGGSVPGRRVIPTVIISASVARSVLVSVIAFSFVTVDQA